MLVPCIKFCYYFFLVQLEPRQNAEEHLCRVVSIMVNMYVITMKNSQFLEKNPIAIGNGQVFTCAQTICIHYYPPQFHVCHFTSIFTVWKFLLILSSLFCFGVLTLIYKLEVTQHHHLQQRVFSFLFFNSFSRHIIKISISLDRKRLFSLINDLPTVFEVVTERKPINKPSVDTGSKSRISSTKVYIVKY